MATTDSAATTTPRTDLDLDAYKAQLLALKGSSDSTLSSMAVEDEEGLNSAGTDGAELSNADNHPADLGTELQLRGQDAALMENERDILAQIDKALARIADGTYGYSERSGKPIPKERLDAQPYATLTVDEQDF